MKINVIIKPGSTKGPLLITNDDGSLTIFVREIAVDGQANQAIIKLIAKHYNVAKTNVTILRGHTSKYKLIEIEGIQ